MMLLAAGSAGAGAVAAVAAVVADLFNRIIISLYILNSLYIII